MLSAKYRAASKATVIIPASVVVFLSFASLCFIDLRISSKNTYIAAVYVTIVNLILFINNYKIKGLTFFIEILYL
jgi:hypothetical protein